MHPQLDSRATRDSFQLGKARRAKPAIGPQVFHTQHCEHDRVQNRPRATRPSFRGPIPRDSVKAKVSLWLPLHTHIKSPAIILASITRRTIRSTYDEICDFDVAPSFPCSVRVFEDISCFWMSFCRSLKAC